MSVERITADWLSAKATQRVMAVLSDAGFCAYAVGGCVRNALLGVSVSDVDITTNARPDKVIALFNDAGLRTAPTGIGHGTVTVIVSGSGYEITTFRADVETDGRRAVVRFADHVADDAQRRDFTMNALYADANGVVTDPLGGLPDLFSRRVRFIGDARSRIREDFLRTLRFFRFCAWYGDPDIGFDADALAGIADTLDGLEQLSRERVGQEVTKLLSAPDPAPSVAVMEQVGVLSRVMPGGSSRLLAPLVHEEQRYGLSPDPLRRLAAIGFFNGADLRLSKAQQKQLGLYQSLISQMMPLDEAAYRHGADRAWDLCVLRAVSFSAPVESDAAEQIARGAQARFPVTASDLPQDLKGPQIGAALRTLEARFIASGFTATRQELLQP